MYGLWHEENDLGKLVEVAEAKLRIATVDYIGALNGWFELAERNLLRKLSRLGVHRGDPFKIRFSDGAEDVIFEGITTKWDNRTLLIRVRHLTKRGSPRKHVSEYGLWVMTNIVAPKAKD